jgi:GntR family transcriptional regulator/MocR family aminotransferase
VDNFSPTLEQLAMAHMLERGHYQRHIRKTRAIYRARRDQLVAALAEHFPELTVSGVAAGLSVMLNLPGSVDDRELECSALAAGIRLEALSRYAIRDRGQRGLVLGYGRIHETALSPAVKTLRRLVAPILA